MANVAADDLYQEIIRNLNLKLACILLVTGNYDGGVNANNNKYFSLIQRLQAHPFIWRQ